MNNDNTILLIDGNNGIWLPKQFAKIAMKLPNSNYKDLRAEFKEIEETSTDYENYWFAWEDILSAFHWTNEDGIVYTLHHNNDLFGVTDQCNIEDL